MIMLSLSGSVRAQNQGALAPGIQQAPREDKDLETIKQRLRAALLPTGERDIQTLTQTARQYADKLEVDGSWKDIDYNDQTRGPWKNSQHLNRVTTLAKAYHTPGQALYSTPELKAKLMAALDYWLQRDFRNPNWWHNQIGVPQMIGDIFILLDKEVSADQLKRGIAILQRSGSTNEAGKPANWTGANLVWIASNQMVRGCLENSPATVAEAFAQIFNEIRLVKYGEEGIQTDYSFHQHGNVLYSGGYGAAFTSSTANFIDYARDTRFAISPERLNILINYVLDGQQWMVRGGVWDYGVTGREITRAGKNARGLAGAMERLAKIPGPRQQELEVFANRLRTVELINPVVGNFYLPLSGNRHYWKSDFIAHHRLGYYTSARMFSTRMLNTDAYINSEGKKSHHIADGANFIYRTGEEYRDIFPVWDWRRVPGITCELKSEPLDPARMQARGKTNFVGGVSNGHYGLAVMDLARDDLTAKKSWFFFEDEFVCLGAGIRSTSNNAVLTSINQCLLKGNVEVSNGAQPLAAGDRELQDIEWVLHDSIGYLFPNKARMHIKNQAQTGSWADIGAGSADEVSKDVFSLWLDHGAKVDNGSYAYIVVPNTNRQLLEARARQSDVEIVSNTATLQAIRHDGLKLLDAAFWQAGLLNGGRGWNLTVDKPCLLLLRETGAGVEFTLANPENKPLTVQVVIDRPLQGDGCIPLPQGGTRILFDLPGGEEAGRSIGRVLKSQ